MYTNTNTNKYDKSSKVSINNCLYLLFTYFVGKTSISAKNKLTFGKFFKQNIHYNICLYLILFVYSYKLR